MNKKECREWHEHINKLSHAEVAALARNLHPDARARKIDRIAKLLIEDAHHAIPLRKKRAVK